MIAAPYVSIVQESGKTADNGGSREEWTPPVSDNQEAAKEALASVYRAVAATPVVGGATGAALYKDCERWALHFLTAEPAPGVADAERAGEPQWAQARLAFRSLRKAEQASVRERESTLAGLVGDVVAGLRDASSGFDRSAATIEDNLSRVQGLLGRVDGKRLEQEFVGMADALRVEVNTQREELQRQVEDMHQRVRQAEAARADAEAHVQELRRSLAEMRNAMEETRQRMQIDPLTKIYNRGAFDTTLNSHVEFAQASDQPLVLILFDLDHFKKVNDEHGHMNGDRVLKAFADLLTRSFLRADDFVARFGGEEFAVLLFVNNPEVVPKLLGNLLQRLRDLRLPALGPRGRLTCSAGYAVLADGESHEAFFKRADVALYSAKNGGRDRFVAAH